MCEAGAKKVGGQPPSLGVRSRFAHPRRLRQQVPEVQGRTAAGVSADPLCRVAAFLEQAAADDHDKVRIQRSAAPPRHRLGHVLDAVFTPERRTQREVEQIDPACGQQGQQGLVGAGKLDLQFPAGLPGQVGVQGRGQDMAFARLRRQQRNARLHETRPQDRRPAGRSSQASRARPRLTPIAHDRHNCAARDCGVDWLRPCGARFRSWCSFLGWQVFGCRPGMCRSGAVKRRRRARACPPAAWQAPRARGPVRWRCWPWPAA